VTENRHPKGTPTGGRFAPSAHAEADVDLAPAGHTADCSPGCFADHATPPLAPAGHPDDEPRGDTPNGSDCEHCGRSIWYERQAAGLPMRWVHRDGTPRCWPGSVDHGERSDGNYSPRDSWP
jgi:hypothetical protein